jgi:dienelactone hydrolase
MPDRAHRWLPPIKSTTSSAGGPTPSAELGYVALAFDIHGGRWFTDPQEMLARCMPLLADPDRMRGIGHAALDVLRAEPRTDPDRIAAIGYGTGGAIALELGRDGVELRAIGTVNGLITGRPGEAARIRCPVWAGVGSEDPIMPPAQRDAFAAEMQAGGVDWRMVIYGGALHAFHYPDHPDRPDPAPRRRLPPAARPAGLARRRRAARRVPARIGVSWRSSMQYPRWCTVGSAPRSGVGAPRLG